MTSTVPTECGKCWKCGYILYLGMTHSCPTAVTTPAPAAPAAPTAPTPNIEWLHRFINCTPFGADAPASDIARAHEIVTVLERERDEARHDALNIRDEYRIRAEQAEAALAQARSLVRQYKLVIGRVVPEAQPDSAAHRIK